MNSQEIRSRFLNFFEKRGHKILPSASLIPENDPSVLFTTAGMQPLVPYLLGQPHSSGKRLANVQKCVRTGDVDEVGDNTHLTFFEMLGNWSLGDYFKEDAIKWSYELLTDKKEGYGLDPNRLYVTCFEGDEDAPRDEESAKIWEFLGMPKERIYFLPKDKNWWSPGDNGPCGPDTEMFYDVTENGLGKMTREEFLAADERQEVIEIWNDVFMEYEKKDGKVIGKLKQKNVDTGAGLERLAMVLQGKDNVFETDLFAPIISVIEAEREKKSLGFSLDKHVAGSRVLVDHFKAAVFLITDGVVTSNKERGYVLRRLLRRTMIYHGVRDFYEKVIDAVGNAYKTDAVGCVYKNVYELNTSLAKNLYLEELNRFEESRNRGLKEFDKHYRNKGGSFPVNISGKEAFEFFSTFGITKEAFLDLFTEDELGKIYILSPSFDSEYEKEFKKHQELSRTSSAGMFKGGLASQGEKTIKLHTAHHLLLAALQEVLGKNVKQKGSNITEERLRIDFSFERKMTDEEKKQVEDIVNNYVSQNLSVTRREMSREEAEKIGAEMEFGAKYPDTVSVYFIEDKEGNVISKEFCGGPHAEHTGVLGKFKIKKEEAVSAGARRIKATLE